MNQPLPHRLVAEAVGTAMLLAAVVGPGIMVERLAAVIAQIGGAATALFRWFDSSESYGREST